MLAKALAFRIAMPATSATAISSMFFKHQVDVCNAQVIQCIPTCLVHVLVSIIYTIILITHVHAHSKQFYKQAQNVLYVHLAAPMLVEVVSVLIAYTIILQLTTHVHAHH